MKVKFLKARFKNFLSYGNAESEFVYDGFKATSISGKNGFGKSSLALDVICYALFNKAYRDIKLGQLINSINNKELLVTLFFSIGTDSYKVVRGQKPAVFEIWKNDVLIKEDSNSRDYQALLESILGFNYKTFKQIVVIGSANYVPFMELSAADRRQIIEEILDISVFSGMQDIAKKTVTDLKASIKSLEYELTLAKEQHKEHKRALEAAQTDQEAMEEVRKGKIAEIESELSTLDLQMTQIEESLQAVKVPELMMDELLSGKESVVSKISELEHSIRNSKNSMSFFLDSDECPKCTQTIPSSLKKSVMDSENGNIRSKTEKKNAFNEILEKFNKKIESVNEIYKKQSALNTERRIIQTKIDSYNKNLKGLLKESTETTNSLVPELKKQLKENIERILFKSEEKSSIQTNLEYYSMAVNMLKDTGIKSRIISNFIPIINQYINEYLGMFDMFIQFELDETFNETIKSRNRDIFSYNSFSEGEKMRISMSILFAWRKVAMAKNSVSTNILIFDEILDKSLDSEGIATFLDIMAAEEDDTNMIVISHRENLPEVFDRNIRIKKVNDFSIIEEY